MKKISLFFVILALLSAQIVKADNGNSKVTTLDATLKYQGTENEASTIAWLQNPSPDPSKITMSVNSFNKEFKNRLVAFNDKYHTFAEVTDDIINDEIISKLYVEDLDPNKLYRVSRYDLETKKWDSYLRKPKKLSNGKIESGLFYPGWEEPILSVYCWNFGYPSSEKVAPVLKVEEPKTEVTIIPGTNKYFYRTDTIRERNDIYKEVQNNFFLKTENNNFASTRNNQSYDVDMSERQQPQRQQSCDCPEQKQVSYASNRSCGCDNDHICSDHYNRLSLKERKRLGDRTWFRIGTHLVAFAAGWLGNEWIGGGGRGPGNVITQGPFIPLPSTNPIYTQGLLNPLQ